MGGLRAVELSEGDLPWKARLLDEGASTSKIVLWLILGGVKA